MADTYDKIQTQTLGSNTATVTFSSISSAYTDLVIVFKGSATSAGTLSYRFNGDSGANYSDTYLYGDGGGTGSGRHSSENQIYGGGVNTNQSMQIINVMNYSNSTTYKNTLLEANANGSDTVSRFVGLWRSTAAINSIAISIGSNFTTGSTFTIYGILKA